MGGIAHEDAAPRRSAAVKARRSRLAEHGAQRRAHGLDGETGVLPFAPTGNPPLLSGMPLLKSGRGGRSSATFERLVRVEL